METTTFTIVFIRYIVVSWEIRKSNAINILATILYWSCEARVYY